MARACHTPIRMATGDAFSDAEIDDILERLKNRFRERTKSGPATDTRAQMAAAAAEMTRSELKRLLMEKRLELASQVARDARRKQIDGMGAGMDEADRLRAFSVGSEKQGVGTSNSVEAEGIARAISLMADVDRGLRERPGVMGRLSNFWNLEEKGFARQVAREMARLTGDDTVKPTGDADAELAARVLSGALEKARLMQNQAGAWIEHLPGYIARQSHDRLKVAGGFWREFEGMAGRVKAGGLKGLDWQAMQHTAETKAFRTWRDFIGPKLDDRTFGGLDPADLGKLEDAARLHANGVIDSPTDLRERFLYRVWSDIVSGRRETMSGASDAGDFVPSASKARSVSQSRVLHFKSPDAWMDYHERFGQGSLMRSVMAQLNRAGRNTALMTRWGPAPEAAFKNEVDRLIEEARGRGAAGAVARLSNRMRAAELGQITGANNVAEDLRLAMIGKAIRVDQSLAKLGGVVLSQLGTDEALAAHSFKRMGATWIDGYRHVWSGIARLGAEDGKKAAALCDVMARSSSQHMMGTFHSGDGPLGWGAWAARVLMKVTGSEALATGHHFGVATGIAAHFGEQSKFAWDGLHIGARETLERFGISPADWDLIRKGAYDASDGNRYLTFDALDQVRDEDAWAHGGLTALKAKTPEAAQVVRDGLKLRLQTMVNNIMDDSIPHARAREQVSLTRGHKPGTILGEAIRISTQFWGFHTSVMGRHLVPGARGFAGQSPAALMAHLILATTLGGAFSLEAKQIVAGRTPRPFVDENGNFDPKIWIASALQGGGLGIYGDFIFGEANRNGQKFGIEELTGPGVSELESLAQLVKSAVSGSDKHLPAEMLNFGRRNLPFNNVWFTRMALDYLILHRLQEAVSPGYLARHEQRLEAEQHTRSLFAPATVH